MATRRRHPRRRQTRRQTGGGREEEFDIIRAVYRHVGSPGALIAAIYNTREIYGKCSEAPPKSRLGYDGHHEIAIPERYGRPDPHKKPLNSVIRCAFNFFNKHASEFRDEEGGHDELRQARHITIELRGIFATLVDADSEKRPSGNKIKKADKLFHSIRDHMGRESGAVGGAGAAAVVKEHIKAAERREKEREREARAAAAAAAAAERAATAAAEAEAAAAWAYKAAVEAEAFGTNLGTARRNWEYAHRHSMAPTGGASNHYSPMSGRWGKTLSSPM